MGAAEVTAYYNENDPKAAAWLRELIKQGHIAAGEVDERSIEDVKPSELKSYTQCHFFAGIGGWSYALRLAGWPDSEPVWTGSCPCTTHSTAARGKNKERDWWPYWKSLIAASSPRAVFSEQVSNVGAWFDSVCSDLEALDYSIGAAILPAVGVGQDHIRNRLYFVGHSNKHRKPVCGINAKAQGMPRNSRHSSHLVFPDGVSKRVAIRGFGNAIVPQVAQAFIEAYLDATKAA